MWHRGVETVVIISVQAEFLGKGGICHPSPALTVGHERELYFPLSH